MKILSTFLLVFMFTLSTNAYVLSPVKTTKKENTSIQFNDEYNALDDNIKNMAMEDFLALTPKKYKEITGQKLGIKKAIQLKVAQKFVKKQLKKKADISSGVYVLLAILGLGWLAMGLLDDWSGNNWIINLVLTVLCWLPGLIHALVKKKEYYGGGK